MATLYWGGGTGNWDNSTTTNWYSDLERTTLAGVVPTSADDVVFDSASFSTSYTVTVTASVSCKNWTVTGPASGTVTISSSSGTVNIDGSVSWASTGVARLNNLALVFTATSGSYTINGILLGGIGNITIGPASSSTADWTLTSAMSYGSGTLTIRSGTFNTGNFNITGAFNSSTTTYVRTINLGTSTITSTTGSGTFFNVSATNLTLNASDSTINRVGGSAGGNTQEMILGNGFSYGTITTNQNRSSFLDSAGCNITTNGGTVSINLLSFTSASTPSGLVLDQNSTFNVSTFRLRTTTPGNRILVTRRSPWAANLTPLNLNVDTLDFPGNCVDFSGINAGGAASWSNDGWGDAGYNTGITFTSPRTLYYTGGNSTIYSTASKWALTSGGSDSGYTIRAHDTVIIDNNSTPSGGTITIGDSSFRPTLGSIYASDRTLPLTLTFRNFNLTGNLYSSSLISTVAETRTLRIIGASNTTLSLNGMACPSDVQINKPNTSFSTSLSSAFSCLSGITLSTGSFNTNNYNITATGFSGSASSTTGVTYALNSGSSLITVNTVLFSAGTVAPIFNTSGTTFLFNMTGTTVGSMNTNISNANSAPTNVKYVLGGTGTGTFTIGSSSSTFRVPYFESFRKNASILITGTFIAQFNDLKITANIGNRTSISSTSTSAASISSPTGKKFDFDYIDLSYMNAIQSNTFFAGKNGTSVAGANMNWVFGSYNKRPQKGNALGFLS